MPRRVRTRRDRRLDALVRRTYEKQLRELECALHAEWSRLGLQASKLHIPLASYLR